MAEPRPYRGHGPGHDTRRHSSRKRTRGEDERDTRHAKRRYDGDEMSIDGRRDNMQTRRSLSPRDYEGMSRQRSHQSRHNTYRRDERHRDCDSDYDLDRTSQMRREEQPSDSRSHHRTRARSPSTQHHQRRRHHRSETYQPADVPDELPFGSRRLVRSDLENFRPLFAQYLEVQKQKDIAALDEREVRGRWKSFVGKWNHGSLAEGWYDPEMLAEARRNWDANGWDASSRLPPLPYARRDRERSDSGSSAARHKEGNEDVEEKEESDAESDEYGPALPADDDTSDPASRSARHGPGIPSLQDLALRREQVEEDREHDVEQLRLARRADRTQQRERLDELVPRADAGTRERRLEKRREVNDKMRGFRERSPGAAAVGEAELMGGNEADEVAEYKRTQEAARRRRSEREVRREEEARARAAEREDRVREYRRKEESTMQVLRQIARERFG
ncbi:hypothetical protein GGR52DRAFT_532947 [Hypoxylon sp. FL1284]|nr:hypothetical protein GGR52DRAFT_532947 [Hypoxylon sp. FL1284]